MVSTVMSIKEQQQISGSDSPSRSIDKISIAVKFTGDDSTPKVRKPYTISKQRERWTEEEHSKFLEALKLYSRAWKKIEEHVGTKTAVQIRSHAQKFFSKVVREPNTGDSSSEKTIEIPPPRPKRKPMHPYPHKLVFPVKNGGLTPENRSPTCVLSAAGSDTSVEEGSCTPKGRQSPVSDSEIQNTFLGEVRSSIPVHEYENSSSEDEASLKLELSSQNDNIIKENSKKSAIPFFKLFGKTLLVDEPQEPSHSSIRVCKPEWGPFPYGPNPVDTCPVPVPWLTLCGGDSLATLLVHNPTPVNARVLYDNKEKIDKDEEMEGSSTGSNSDTEDADVSVEKKENIEISFSSYKFGKRNSANSVDYRRGFRPYKRNCFGSTALDRIA